MAIFPKEIMRSHEFLAGVEAGLSRLREKPVLLLWGDADTGFTETERRRFERLLPSSTTRILVGAHHFIQEDAPEQMSKEILRFEGGARR